MSQYYFPVFDDLSRLEKHQTIVNLLEDVIIPNIPSNNDLEWMDVVSYGYSQAKQYQKSIDWGEKILSASNNPQQKYNTRFNLVKNYLNINYPETVLKYCDLNLKVDPEDWEMQLYKSIAFYALNEKEKSYEILKDLSKNKQIPTKPLMSVHFNMGIHLLREGKFKEGMQKLSIGRKMKIWGSHTHKFGIPQWDGKSYPGKSILFVGEGGIGDEFISARFYKHIRDMGMIPHFASCHHNAKVFKRIGFETARNYTKFKTDIPDIQDFDFWLPVMDIGFIMDLDFKDLWYGSYVNVDEKYNEKWKSIIPKSNKKKVGLKWRGNPLYEHELHRTIPIQEIIKNLDDYELVSLQKEDADELNDRDDVLHLNDKLETIDDLIGAIEQLDLVITSCTSIAHISAAMGKKTIIFVPIMNYHIWSEEGNKSSWYGDNVILMRQQTPRKWDECIIEMKNYI